MFGGTADVVGDNKLADTTLLQFSELLHVNKWAIRLLNSIMYVQIHMLMYVHMKIHTCIYVHEQFICMYMYIQVHMYKYVHVHVCTCIM